MDTSIHRHLYYRMRAKQILTVVIIFVFANVGNAQLTIKLTSLPIGTPPNSSIYVAGSFNNWNFGEDAYKLTNNNDGTYSITFYPRPVYTEYKFTRGNAESVEGSAAGTYMLNRTFTYDGTPQSIETSIAGWEYVAGTHTATGNVELLDDDFFIPQLNANRNIWIYLPPDYATSDKKYPVLYMQDGQNLFDAFYNPTGEWKIDESLDILFIHGDFGAIVVGVANGGPERISEYSPWMNITNGGGHGEAYADFMANTLKPFIDKTYRTMPEREYTAIAGSTLGANIALYTAIEYQDVFGKVGVFSPAFWYSDSSYVHLHQKGIHQDLKIYFVAGQNESDLTITEMKRMYDALAREGQDESEMHFVSIPDGAHSEWFWGREFPDAYKWLFANSILANETDESSYWKIYPKPTGNYLIVLTSPEDLPYSIYKLNGTSISSGKLRRGCIDISALAAGGYFLQLANRSGQTIFVSRFVKE
jgi:predicted alpha/beta superfamily hydrolase